MVSLPSHSCPAGQVQVASLMVTSIGITLSRCQSGMRLSLVGSDDGDGMRLISVPDARYNGGQFQIGSIVSGDPA